MKLQDNLRSATVAWIVVAFVWIANPARAVDKGGVDPTGTWKLTSINAETKAKGPERTLKLKLEDGKLTGTIDGRSEINGKVKIFEWPLKDAKLQGNNISFTVSHPPTAGNGPNSTTTYEAKITGEMMRGTSETEWNGNIHKRDFEAKRVKNQGP